MDGEIFTCIVLCRLVSHIYEECLPETQSGFRIHHRMIDVTLTATQIKESCSEQRMPFCAIFIDLT